MPEHGKIDYLEYSATDLEATKSFFIDVFGWSFVDFGPDYSCFNGSGLTGGFFRSPLKSRTEMGAALIVFYSERLEETYANISAANGEVVREVFEFPGGRRFHFTDPSGNEFGVWSDKDQNGNVITLEQ